MDNNNTTDEKAKTEKSTFKMLEEIGVTHEQAEARLAVGGILGNANIARLFYGKPMSMELDIGEVFQTMHDRSVRVNKGNLKDAETILISQATALDSIFSGLTVRSFQNMGEYLDAAEKYMKLALRAQNQCRATVETLAMIKNPQPYVRQLNQAVNQQVNNASPAPAPSYTRTSENLIQSNELLEDRTNEQEWLDTRTPKETIRSNKEMEAMAEINRSEDT